MGRWKKEGTLWESRTLETCPCKSISPEYFCRNAFSAFQVPRGGGTNCRPSFFRVLRKCLVVVMRHHPCRQWPACEQTPAKRGPGLKNRAWKEYPRRKRFLPPCPFHRTRDR